MCLHIFELVSYFYISIYARNSSELSLFLFVKVGQLHLQKIANQLNSWLAQFQDMTHHNTYKDFLAEKEVCHSADQSICTKIFPKKNSVFQLEHETDSVQRF